MAMVIFEVTASLNEDSLSYYKASHYIGILTCLDDSTVQKSKFCIVSENFVSQNPDVQEKTDYRFEISNPKLP